MSASLNPALSVYSQRSESIEATGTGINIASTYIVPAAQVATFESTFPLNSAHPTYTSSFLTRRKKDPWGGDDGVTALFLYSLQYGVPSAAGTLGVKPAGTEQKSSDSNLVDVPIMLHPAYLATWAQTKPGVETYLLSQPTYTHVETIDRASFDFTEDSIAGQAGRIAKDSTLSAAGLNAATSDGWLLIRRSVLDQGDVVEITRVWQYAENGWDTDIYATEP